MTESRADRPPFFIVGVPRSGTTLLRLMLNSHPNLCVPFESAFIPRFFYKLGSYGPLSDPRNAERLLRDISEVQQVKRGQLVQDPRTILSYPIRSYSDLIHAIFAEYAKRKGKKRWGDKSPGYVTDIDVLWKLFPGCKIIHIVRDGRDVAVSLRKVSWGRRSIPELATRWKWMSIVGHKVGSVLGNHYLEIRYEDLVLKTEETVRAICDFLDEPYHTGMLTFHRTANSEMPGISMKWHESSVRPPDPNKVYAWKRMMSRADRTIFEQHAAEALELFGYELERLPVTLATRMKRAYYCLTRR